MNADQREIYGAPTQAVAQAALVVFIEKYAAKYAHAAACLIKVREVLLVFFDFPAEHWEHLWATNPTQGVSATVWHRTVQTESSLLLANAKLIVFKLVLGAANTSRRIKGENQSPKVGAGVIFRDETEVVARSDHRAA